MPHAPLRALAASADDLSRSMPLPGLSDLAQPVFLLDAMARVIAANASGWLFLDEPGGLCRIGRGLQAATAGETHRFRRAVADIRTGEAPQRSKQVTLSTPGQSGGVTILLLAWGKLEVLALVHEPAQASKLPARRFGLTSTETALAEDLLQGWRLKQIAVRRERSLNTIRSQLAAIMKKTQTTSQADLVRVLMQPS